MQTDQFRPTAVLVRVQKKPRHLKQVAGFWRRPIDLRTPIRWPAARAGLTVYLARFPSARSLYGMRRSAAPCSS